MNSDTDFEELRLELAELKARVAYYENMATWQTTCSNCATLLDSCYAETMRAEEAEAAIAKVRAMHPVERHYGRSVCGHCRDGWEDPVPYPCPTIAALEG
jgi:hypothetical protein